MKPQAIDNPTERNNKEGKCTQTTKKMSLIFRDINIHNLPTKDTMDQKRESILLLHTCDTSLIKRQTVAPSKELGKTFQSN